MVGKVVSFENACVSVSVEDWPEGPIVPDLSQKSQLGIELGRVKWPQVPCTDYAGMAEICSRDVNVAFWPGLLTADG